LVADEGMVEAEGGDGDDRGDYIVAHQLDNEGRSCSAYTYIMDGIYAEASVKTPCINTQMWLGT
jgi:hypothetical protein